MIGEQVNLFDLRLICSKKFLILKSKLNTMEPNFSKSSESESRNLQDSDQWNDKRSMPAIRAAWLVRIVYMAWSGFSNPCVFADFRYLYWVNRGGKGLRTIETAGMDGSDRKVLAVVNMEEPTGLTLDHVASRLYWISAYKEVPWMGQEEKVNLFSRSKGFF